MANSLIQVPPDNTGKKVATFQKTEATQVVEVQKVLLAGQTPDDDIVPKNAAPGASDYALPVRAGDGHLVAVGATADADTALTVIGRLKKLLTLLPAALVGGRLDVNIGAAPTTVPVSGPLTDGELRATPVPVIAAQGTAANLKGQVQGEDDHDIPITGKPVLVAGRASAAAPADVSADGDAVRAWMLRNGARCVVLTAAGALIAGDAANGLDVDVTRMPTGASAAQAQGDAGHDAADSGNPLGVGGIARTAWSAVSAALDRVKATFDTLGRLITLPFAPRELHDTQHTQIVNTTTETTICTAVASEHHDIVCLVITNQAATAVNVTIKDATAGTTRAILALAASGGIVIAFPAPWAQKAAVNNNWTATLSVATVTVNILVNFVKVP